MRGEGVFIAPRDGASMYSLPIVQVVFEGKQDPEYWPERLPQQVV